MGAVVPSGTTRLAGNTTAAHVASQRVAPGEEARTAQKASGLRRKTAMKDPRTAIEKYVDQFWKENVTLKHATSVSEIDRAVHKLIHQMLVMAHDEPQYKHSVH